MPPETKLKESAARKMIDLRLKRLGWNTDENDPSCNAFTERPKLESQAQLIKGNQPDYVLYAPNTNDPIAIIEAKQPGQTLNKAIAQGRDRYAKPLGVSIVFATDGQLCETHDTRCGGPLRIDGEPVVDLLSPELLVRFAREGPSLEMPQFKNCVRGQQTRRENSATKLTASSPSCEEPDQDAARPFEAPPSTAAAARAGIGRCNVQRTISSGSAEPHGPSASDGSGNLENAESPRYVCRVHRRIAHHRYHPHHLRPQGIAVRAQMISFLARCCRFLGTLAL